MTAGAALVSLFSGHSVVVIGAAALELAGMHTGATLDFDVAINIGLEACVARLEASPDWARAGREEHAWSHRSGEMVDVLPVDRAAIERGYVDLTSTGRRLNVAGYSFAFADPIPVASYPGLLRARPEAIAVLKMAAYLDRPTERLKDLSDLAYLFWTYVSEEDDRLYVGEAAGLDLWGEEASTYLLGLDAGKGINERERQLVETFLDTLIGGPWHRERLIRATEFRNWSDDEVIRYLELFRQGVRAAGA